MIIHLIAAGKLENPDQWPDVWHHCYNIWESSPYEIKLWGNEDIDSLLKEDDEEFFKILNTLPSIYKWDYVRYVILEKFGGAYFDMDVEVVDGSFLNILPPDKMFFMEGISGTYLENSIMITPPNSPLTEFWKRLKLTAQHNIKMTPKTELNPPNVIWKVGPGLLSKFFIDATLMLREKPWELLGYQQFGSTTNSIVFTRHYQTSLWNK